MTYEKKKGFLDSILDKLDNKLEKKSKKCGCCCSDKEDKEC